MSVSAVAPVAHPARQRAAFYWQACALCFALAGCAATPPLAPQTPAAHNTAVDPLGLFPMQAYDQEVDHALDPASAAYDQPFLSPAAQQAQRAALYARYFGVAQNDPSPWNPAFVATRVYRQGGGDIAALQQHRLEQFDNNGKSSKRIGYGQDFRPHTAAWLGAIAHNIEVAQFERNAGYHAAQRAIATDNALVRELPTLDPSFYDRRLAGEGYPFDNLQISAVRPGTPLYVLGVSIDGAWRYVQTPDVQGWVRSEAVGLVDQTFVTAWRTAAQHALGAVIAAGASVNDTQGAFRFEAPAGTLLPIVAAGAGTVQVWVPARDADARAHIRTALLSSDQIVPTPWSATPRHLALLLKNLIGRPYGWGNTGFYNDCSSELQSIYAAFGVWLPRHSSTQMSAGRMTDLSDSTPAERLDYLMRHGAPLRTLIYIGGHVMLYLGNTSRDGRTVALVYNDIWGLRPADNSRRAVIGGSAILPLLEHYPEDPALSSLAATPIFQITILDAAPQAVPNAPPADDDNPAS
jgi:hypothetical protein